MNPVQTRRFPVSSYGSTACIEPVQPHLGVLRRARVLEVRHALELHEVRDAPHRLHAHAVIHGGARRGFRRPGFDSRCRRITLCSGIGGALSLASHDAQYDAVGGRALAAE